MISKASSIEAYCAAAAASREKVLYGTLDQESAGCSASDTKNRTSVELVNVRKYLQDVEQELKDGGMYRLQLTNSHRKMMLRAIIGVTKVELDNQMRRERARLQHDQILKFLKNDLVSELENGTEIDEDDAPCFRTALDKILTEDLRPKSTPLRASADGICSPLARGRVYKGKFIDLLSDLAPELVPNYHSAAYVAEQDVMLSLVNNLDQGSHVDVKLCTECIKCSLPDDKDNAESKKASDGQQCEARCLDFLSGRSMEESRIILSNVFVKPRHSEKPSENSTGGAVIVTPIDLDATCSEFDALIVEKVNDEQSRTTASVRVCEVWEAKATISPLTIHDALTKKAAAMNDILASKSEIILLDRIEYTLSGNCEPVFGIFGNELLPPKRAATQVNMVECLHALSSNVHTVSEALEVGYVTMSSDRSIQSIRRLQSVVEDFESLVVAISQ
jgi:hypothetical protein